MIEIRNLTKKCDFTILDGVSLTLPDRGLICITGESGSGKTTFLNLLLEIIKPTSGEIAINGVRVSRKQSFRILDASRKYAAFFR